ncbi:MAG: HDIG domain-containing protein [Clostridia bacterium]
MKIKNKNKFMLDKKEMVFVIFVTLLFCLLFCLVCEFAYFNKTDIGKISLGKMLSFCGLVLILFMMLVLYIYFSDSEVLKSRRKLLALYTAMLLSFGVIILVTNISQIHFSVYAAPFALCALLVALLIGVKCSFFANFIVIMIFFLAEIQFSTVVDAQKYFPLFCGITTGIIGTYSISKFNRRTQYLLGGMFIGLIAFALAVVTFFLFGEKVKDFTEFWGMCLFSLLSGLVNIGLFFVVVPLMERVFNLVTDFRLAELASANQPLIKRLMVEAPGTFNHSMLVASYAEACAGAIGADTFIARAAGYYHDIGKLKDPQYFVENQISGHNPHDDISAELSVMFIKKHTMNGLALAIEYKLPVEIKRAITEHHGTLPIRYFYAKAKRITEGGDLNIKEYSYDGPKPTDKISAIIMIADASEAALRASNDKSRAAAIVDDIVKERFDLGQFTDCDITMSDLETIKRTILTTYLGIKHERIKYPDAKVNS